MKKSKRSKKSNTWKIKQNRDQFVKKSKTLGYRSRASFKLLELNEKFNFQNSVLKHVPQEWENYEVILGNKISIDELKWMKVLKYGKKALLRNPGAIFKKNRTIKFQFDMFHGNGVLDKAIDVLMTITTELNADWRSVYRANHLLSLIYMDKGNDSSSKKYLALCLNGNPRFPV